MDSTTVPESESLNSSRSDPTQGGTPLHAGILAAAPESPAGTGSLHASLRALREVETALAQEQGGEAILRAGVTAAAELVGAECCVGLADPAPGEEELRVGSSLGGRMAQHEIEVLLRSLDREILEVRSGRAASVVLATAHWEEGAETSGEPPAAMQSREFGSVLIVGLGQAGHLHGALILARREAHPFDREQLAMAELLALPIAAQLEEVRRRALLDRLRDEIEAKTSLLGERDHQLEAMRAIPTAIGPSFDRDRQMDLALRIAIDGTRSAAGTIHLVEPGVEGKEVLRFSRGSVGQSYLEMARLPRWNRGEGLLGRVWESGEPLVLDDLAAEPDLLGREALLNAGYKRMLALALKAKGRTIGVLTLFGDDDTAYAGADVHRAGEIAEQVGTALHAARLLSDVMHNSLDLEQRVERQARDLNRHERNLQAVHAAITMAARATDAADLGEGVIDCAIGMSGGRAASIHRFDETTQTFRLFMHRGFRQGSADEMEVLEPDDPVLNSPDTEEGGAVIDTSSEGGLEVSRWAGTTGYRYLTVIPFKSRQQVRGVLMLAGDEGSPLGAAQRAVLGGIAGLIEFESYDDSAWKGEPSRRAGPSEAGEAARGEEPTEASEHPGSCEGILPDGQTLRPQLLHAQRLESIGALAGGVAHNFNNIVAGIMGHASHLKSLVPSEGPIYKKATIIEQQSMQAVELTGQLRAFARGGEGDRELLDLNKLVAETVSLLSKSLDPSIVLEASAATDLPAVEGDPGELRQVLLNVAVNARDAMPDGGRITFETRSGHLDDRFVESIPGLKSGDYVAVVVSDTGTGMDSEVMERALEPFYTTKPVGCGTGLGLAVTRDVIKSHGGHVAISSATGVGTAVRIYLPSAGCPASPQAAAPTPRTDEEELSGEAPTEPASGTGDATNEDAPSGPREAATQPVQDYLPAAVGDGRPATPDKTSAESAQEKRGHGIRVLVVEDEEVLRDMTADMLRSDGYEVVTAKDGVEALEVYRRDWGKFSAVLLDIVMPRLGGLETLRRLRGMDREAKIIICSGYADSEKAQQAVAEGAVGLLHKPFGMNEILGWIQKAIAS